MNIFEGKCIFNNVDKTYYLFINSISFFVIFLNSKNKKKHFIHSKFYIKIQNYLKVYKKKKIINILKMIIIKHTNFFYLDLI